MKILVFGSSFGLCLKIITLIVADSSQKLDGRRTGSVRVKSLEISTEISEIRVGISKIRQIFFRNRQEKKLISS